MKIKAIGWGGTKVSREEHAEISAFFKDVMGFPVISVDEDIIIFRLPSGDIFEVIGPTQATELNDLIDGPKMDFLVDDVHAARKELEARGVEFVTPVLTGSSFSWTNFRGPDGNIYGLTDDPDHPAQKSA
jgi:hypothetical protein